MLCEGLHDVAFINKVMKTMGFVSNEGKKLSQFPIPMNKLMANEFEKTDIENLNLQNLRKGILPINTLQLDDIWVFLYSMGSDSMSESRRDIINKLRNNIRKQGEIKGDRGKVESQFSILYVFDADAIGVQARLGKVKSELRSIFTNMSENNFETNSSCEIIETIKFGCHIFTGVDNNTGKLEDVLMPLFKEENEDIYEDAERFINKHFDESRLFPNKIAKIEGNIVESRSEKIGDKLKFDFNKSIVGVVGQLQKSGGSNTVSIGQTDYLNLRKIQLNVKCIEFASFIQSVITI